MGTTTIQVNGISASGSNNNGNANNNSQQPNQQPYSQQQPNQSPFSTLPSSDRMIEDVRREMRQRGIMFVPGSTSMQQVINEYKENQRRIVNEDISRKYDQRIDNVLDAERTRHSEYAEKVRKQEREMLIASGHENDPFYVAMSNQRIDAALKSDELRGEKRIKGEIDDLEKRAEEEKRQKR